jgi:hypothetical protein
MRVTSLLYALSGLLHHSHVVVIEGNSYRNPPGGRKVG